MAKQEKKNYDLIVKTLEDKVAEGKIKNETYDFYIYSLHKLNSLIGKDEETFNPSAFNKESDKLIKYFSENSNSRNNMFKALLMFLKIIGYKIPDNFDELRKSFRVQSHSIDTLKSHKKLPFDSFSEVIDEYNKFKPTINEILKTSKNVKKDAMRIIAIVAYCTIPPVRPSEYLNLKIVSKPNSYSTTGNYFNVNTGKLKYTDYKTSKVYGDISIDASDDFTEIVKALYDVLDDIDGVKYIFTTSTVPSKIIESPNFTSFFKSIPLFRGLNPTDLRNLYCSSIDSSSSMEDRAKIAMIMKHSIPTQLIIYSKYNKDSYPDK
jgi:hypothetical protein